MENNIDKLFKSKFGMQVPDYDPTTWKGMEDLLDSEGLVPQQKESKKKRWFWMVMLVFVFSSGATFLFYLTDQQSTQGAIEASPAIVEDLEEQSSNKQQSTLDPSIENTQSIQLSNNKEETFKKEDLNHNISNRSIHSTKDNNLSSLQSESSIEHTDSKRQEEYDKESQSNQNFKIPASNFSQTIFGTAPQKSKIALNDDKDIASESIDLNNSQIELQSIKEEGLSSGNIKTSSSREEQAITNRESYFILPLSNRNISALSSKNKITLPFAITKFKHRFITMGLEATYSFSGQDSWSIGPKINFLNRKGSGFQTGLFLEKQSVNGGMLTATKREYSFGSTETTKQFNPDQATLFRIPINYSKRIRDNFSILGGASLGYILAVEGNITNAGDANLTPLAIDESFRKKFQYGGQVGLEYRISRHLHFIGSLEYRSSMLNVEEDSVVDKASLYPSFGLFYSLYSL